MPSTGLYFISVDNTGGRDKTIVTVERMLGNRDVRQIIGSYELVLVPPHGRLIDADALMEQCDGDCYGCPYNTCMARELVAAAPTIIPAEEGET